MSILKKVEKLRDNTNYHFDNLKKSSKKLFDDYRIQNSK